MLVVLGLPGLTGLCAIRARCPRFHRAEDGAYWRISPTVPEPRPESGWIWT
jgi:hypothetical protein